MSTGSSPKPAQDPSIVLGPSHTQGLASIPFRNTPSDVFNASPLEYFQKLASRFPSAASSRSQSPPSRSRSPSPTRETTNTFQYDSVNSNGNLNVATEGADTVVTPISASGSKRPRSPSPTGHTYSDRTFYQPLTIKIEHPVGSMSISPSCRDIVLAARKGLFIIDLDNPYEPPRFLHHLSKWEVADVQWSPHISRQAWIASTSNQKALVWNLEYTGSRAIQHILHAHSRAISDINWSGHHADILATCSVDTFVHLWDLRLAGGESSITEGDRKGMRPALSLCAWTAGATQVKFNRKNEYLLASAHDSDIKIWDTRKGSLPVTNITAHTTKIYGIDWSRQHQDIIVTCSLDKLVKFWNINQPDECVSTIKTNSPVWRARHTPFGNGILTMPQRSDVTLSLWNCDKPEAPAYQFCGHSDTVKEFVWRWRGGPPGSEGDDREFQLVTWSKDQHLQLWPISEQIMKTINHIPSPVRTGLTVPYHADTPEGNHGAYSFRDQPHCSNSAGASPSPAVSTLRVLAGNRISTVSPLRTSIPSSTGVIDFADAPAAGKTSTTNRGVTGVDIYRNYPSTEWNRTNSLYWMKNVKTVRTGEAGGKDGEPEGTYRTLAEELTNVAQRFLGIVKFETINVSARFCIVTLHGPWSDTGVTITFPPGYPDKVAPVFDFKRNTMISMYYRERIQEVTSFANNLAAQRRPSLEACLRYLLGETSIEELENLGGQSGNNYGSFGDWYGGVGDSDDEAFVELPNTGGRRNRSVASDRNDAVDMSMVESMDQNVPFPRLCGAVFSGDGRLVTFFSTLRVHDTISNSTTTSRPNSFPKRALNTHHVHNKSHTRHPSGGASRFSQPTFSDYYQHPRSYDQLGEYKDIAASSKPRNTGAGNGNENGNGFGTGFDEDPDDQEGFGGVISSVYYRPKNFMHGSTRDGHMSLYQPSKPNDVAHTVRIKDMTKWIPYSPVLAKAYLLYGSDPVAICLHNAQVCSEHKRPDLHKIWLLAAEILRTVVPLGIDVDEHKLDSNDPMAIAAVAAAETVALRKAQRATNAKKHLHTVDAPAKLLKMALDLRLLRRQRRDSGTGLDPYERLDDGLAEPTNNNAAPFLGRVQWGLHPLGRKLVNQLFKHFLQLGDVQMLAMMSCVFREPFPPDKLSAEMLEWSYNRNYETDVTQPAHSTNTTSNPYEYFNNHYMHHPERYINASAANFWPLPPMPPRISYTPFTPTSQPSGNLMGPSPVRTASTPSLPLPTIGGESYSSKGYFGMNFGSNPDPHNQTPPTPIATGLSMGYGHYEVPTDNLEGVNMTAIPGIRTTFLTTGDRETYPPNYNSNYKDHQRSQSVNFVNSGSIKPRQNSLPLLSSSMTSSNAPSPPVTPRRPSPSGYRTHSQTFAGKDGSETTSQNGIVVQMVNHQYFDNENIDSHHITLLNPMKASQFDAYRIFYSDMLYRWGLFEQRAELLKFVSFAQGVSAGSVWRETRNATTSAPVVLAASQSWNINPSASNADAVTGGGRGGYVGSLQSKNTEAAHTQSNANMSPPLPSSRIVASVFPQGAVEWLFGDRRRHLEVELLCYKCGSELGLPDNTCLECHQHRQHVKCAICHHLVKGFINFCIQCGHGGHTRHMREWFVDKKIDVCPTGCGCACLLESSEAGV